MTNFKKNFIWNIAGTGLNSFSSLVLMIIVTRINGVDEAGIFTLGFSTACILYVIGNYAGRVYQVTENDKKITDKDYILNRIISFIIMVIVSIAFVIIRKYDIYKSCIFILLAIFKGIEVISEVLYGILQKNDCLYKVGQSFLIKSITTLIIFTIVDIVFHNLIYACISIIVVWLFYFILFDIKSVKKYINNDEKYNIKNALSIFKSGFFVFAITFFGIYMVNAPKYAIDIYLENNIQTIFGIIIMPSTAISLFGQFLFHPYLTLMADLNSKKEYKKLENVTRKVVIYILGIGVFISMGAYLIGIPILNFVYGIDLSDYRILLLVILIAATLYNIGGTYSSLLTTTRKTFIQFIIYIILSILALVASDVLTKKYALYGAVGAYCVLMAMYFILYIVTSKIIIKRMEGANR